MQTLYNMGVRISEDEIEALVKSLELAKKGGDSWNIVKNVHRKIREVS